MTKRKLEPWEEWARGNYYITGAAVVVLAIIGLAIIIAAIVGGAHLWGA